jgi:hypothetical protein
LDSSRIVKRFKIIKFKRNFKKLIRISVLDFSRIFKRFKIIKFKRILKKELGFLFWILQG